MRRTFDWASLGCQALAIRHESGTLWSLGISLGRTRREAIEGTLLFNGYRLDIRSASKFDANHAHYKNAMPAGYYELSAPAAASLSTAFRGPNRPQTNRLGTEYELRPLPRTNMSPAVHCLFDGSSKARTGIQVDSTFFYAARAFARGKSLDGLVLCVQYSAPWMRTALAEVGTREAPGKDADKRILEYYQIPGPVYGAIGIKSRKGGGHVAFVVGKSADGKSLFMLGGNQDDRVNITRYERSVWNTFVVPEKFNSSLESPPTYSQPADAAGSEA